LPSGWRRSIGTPSSPGVTTHGTTRPIDASEEHYEVSSPPRSTKRLAVKAVERAFSRARASCGRARIAVRESGPGRERRGDDVDRGLQLVKVSAEEGEPLARKAGVAEAHLDEVDLRPLQSLLAGEDDGRGRRRLQDEERARPVVAPAPFEGVEEARVDVGEVEVVEEVAARAAEPLGERLLDGRGGPADERQVTPGRHASGTEEGDGGLLEHRVRRVEPGGDPVEVEDGESGGALHVLT
jgi:hypothetical protein